MQDRDVGVPIFRRRGWHGGLDRAVPHWRGSERCGHRAIEGEDVSLAGGAAGVEWIGTIDGLPTTLVYAFNGQHAYEIAPSVVGEGAAGDTQCNAMLQSFLSTLKI